MTSFRSSMYDNQALQGMLMQAAKSQPEQWGTFTSRMEELSRRKGKFLLHVDPSKNRALEHRERLQKILQQRRESPEKNPQPYGVREPNPLSPPKIGRSSVTV